MPNCPVDPEPPKCRPLTPDQVPLSDETLEQIREESLKSRPMDEPSNRVDCTSPSGACAQDPIAAAVETPETLETFLRKHSFSLDCLLDRVIGGGPSR